MVDVGAGAGFPGIVTKIYKPELELTLMEPTGKRVEFLKYACAQLGLTGVEFAKERAEEAARKAWREQFDLASARAVAALPMLAEYCLPLVKVGGSFLAMKGASGEEELAAARGAIRKLGGEYKETRTLHLPFPGKQWKTASHFSERGKNHVRMEEICRKDLHPACGKHPSLAVSGSDCF